MTTSRCLLLGCLLSALLAAPNSPAHAGSVEDWDKMRSIVPRGYVCMPATDPPRIDGRLDDPAWKHAAWTDRFVDIQGKQKPKPRFQTRAKMLWDKNYFYIAADMIEPHVWGTLTKHDSVIFHDNDFEVFIDPDGDTLKNSIIITSEYNQYATTRLDITRSGAKQVWKQPYASGVCPPVIHKGYVYWCWRGLYCLDFKTGQPIWRGGVFGDTASCIVTSDDRLIIWGRRGDLVLAETVGRSARKYTELARRKDLMENDAWPHIVLSGGQLYCRDRDGNMQCFVLSR